MSKPFEVVIVGGGTAGWMTAAALSDFAEQRTCKVTLIESEEIGSVGVGEATLPQMKEFNDYVGLNEIDMMQYTNATFKLGIEFVNWGKIGSRYIHPFGRFGEKIAGIDFHQLWVHLRHLPEVESIERYSYAIQACYNNKFDFPATDKKHINSTYAYAYHFDASRYAMYLRQFAEKKNVNRIEGKLTSITNSPDTGAIAGLLLESGQVVQGDFFIDCSGFRSLLLGKNLEAEFEDWSKWLVCDRAVALPSSRLDDMPPYTRSTAQAAGWQWRIPLQHRTGNGYVYSSAHISDQAAADALMTAISGECLAEPRFLKFKAGRYKASWKKNCVAIGLASGFLEPLESTSIYLIQVAIFNLLKCFPGKLINQSLIDEYNRLTDMEYERIRDFLILHYRLNERDDSDLWRYCREMQIPDSLKEKMEVFRTRGFIDNYKYGLFAPPSWISVLYGQGWHQEGVDPLVGNIDKTQVLERFSAMSSMIDERVKHMPAHDVFLKDYCPVDNAGVNK